MKMYVWKDVLCDYTCGMIVVFAHDLKEARQIAKKQLDSVDYEGSIEVDEPDIYDKPSAVAVWGGG